MSRRKKALSILLILTVMALIGSVSAFAEGENTKSAGETGGGASQIQNSAPSEAKPVSPPSKTETASAPPSKVSPSPQPAAPSMRESTQTYSRRTYSRQTYSRRTRRTLASSSQKPSSAAGTLSSLDSSSSGESGSEVSLPSVASASQADPLSSVVSDTANTRRMNWIGIVSWGCIGLGILVVLLVVLSNRRPPRGTGRKRYHRKKRPKKHLLNDRYYRHINRY